AGHQLFVVHVTGMDPWRCAVDSAIPLRRGFADTAEEWMQRDLDTGGEPGDHALPVQRDDLGARVGKIISQKTRTGAKSVVSIWNGQLDLLDAHFQRVTGLRAFNKNRSRQNMPAGTFVRNFLVNVAQALLHLIRRDASFLQSSGTVGNQRLKD